MVGGQASNAAALHCSNRAHSEGCSVQVTGLTPDQASRIATLASGGCLAALVEEKQIALPERTSWEGTCIKATVGALKPA